MELEQLGNRLINKEITYDMEALKSEHQIIINNLNQDQKMDFGAITKSAERGLGKQIFVQGYGGMGKTSLWASRQKYDQRER